MGSFEAPESSQDGSWLLSIANPEIRTKRPGRQPCGVRVTGGFLDWRCSLVSALLGSWQVQVLHTRQLRQRMIGGDVSSTRKAGRHWRATAPHPLCRTGSPTVMLDAGLGNSSLYWFRVQPEIAQFTRVCSYDRAGLGWSDPTSAPRTAHQIVSDLDALQMLKRFGRCEPKERDKHLCQENEHGQFPESYVSLQAILRKRACDAD
jgi:hypothetical protein